MCRKTRGFTLIELLVAMTVVAILGIALTRLLMSDSEFVRQQEVLMDARQAARAAMNVMTVELRMVSDSGVVAAETDSVTVRIPYAFGVGCGSSGGSAHGSIMPYDSLLFTPTASGMAHLDTLGVYHIVDTVISLSLTANLVCDTNDIQIIAGGSRVQLAGIAAGQHPAAGDIFHLYKTVTYKFAPSLDLPGRVGLWRREGTGPNEELVTPFAATSGFGFLLGDALISSDTVPSALSTIRGLKLRLHAQSEGVAMAGGTPETFEFHTEIVFLNRAP